MKPIDWKLVVSVFCYVCTAFMIPPVCLADGLAHSVPRGSESDDEAQSDPSDSVFAYSLGEVGGAIDSFGSAILSDMDISSGHRLLDLSTNSISSERSVRGIRNRFWLRDYMPTRVSFDTYNTELVEIERGLNSSPWSLGLADSVVNQHLKRADISNNFGSIRYRLTGVDGGSTTPRFEIDGNRVLLEDKLSVRIAALDQGKKNGELGNGITERRGYLNFGYAPWEDTIVQVSHEFGKNDYSWAYGTEFESNEFNYVNRSDFEVTNLSVEQLLLDSNLGFQFNYSDERFDELWEENQISRYDWYESSDFDESESATLRESFFHRFEKTRNEYWRMLAYGSLDFESWMDGRPQLARLLGKHTLHLERAESKRGVLFFEHLWRDREWRNGVLLNENSDEWTYDYDWRAVTEGVVLKSSILSEKLNLLYRIREERRWGDVTKTESLGLVYRLAGTGLPLPRSVYFQSDVVRGMYPNVEYEFENLPSEPIWSREIGVRYSVFDEKLDIKIGYYSEVHAGREHTGHSLLEESIDDYLFFSLERYLSRRPYGRPREDEIHGIAGFFGAQIDLENGSFHLDTGNVYSDLLKDVEFRFWKDEGDSRYRYSVDGYFSGRDRHDLLSEGWELKVEYTPNDKFRFLLNASHVNTRRSLSSGLARFVQDFESTFNRPEYPWWSEYERGRDSYYQYYGVDRELEGAREWVINSLAYYSFRDGIFKGVSVGMNGTWDAVPGYVYSGEDRLDFRFLRSSRGGNDTADPRFNLGVKLGYEKEVFASKVLWGVSLYFDNVTDYTTMYSGATPRNWSLTSSLRF